MIITILVILLAVCMAYALMVRGRAGHPGMKLLQGWSYAHRGLHGKGIPENSMAAFRAAVENGYGAELDVHLLADGGLAVMHDSGLLRTTGREGRIGDLTTDQLKQYRLENTNETIPEFTQVLKLFEGKAPLIIEIKTEKNVNAVCEAVARVLDGYQGVYCVESFHPQAVAWFRKNRPEVIRGQLMENYFRTPESKLPVVLKFIMTNQLLNFWTQPDFVACNYRDRKIFSNCVARGLWKMQGVSWTLQTKEQFDEAVERGWLPIFENFKH